MTLTTEQLGELTERVNDRIDEFGEVGAPWFEPMRAGIVRLVHDVIEEWKQQREEQHDNAWRELARELVRRQEEREQPLNGNHAPVVAFPPTHVAEATITIGPKVAAILGPEHTTVTPLVEVNSSMDDDFDDDFDDAPKPKRGMTDARRRQLDDLKQQRRRKVEYERKASAGKNGNVLPTLDELITEVQRLSMGTGIMPTLATFDAARPGNWATAGAHMHRLEMTWEQLAKEAELRPRLRVGQSVVVVNEDK